MRKHALFTAISLALGTGAAVADEQDQHEHEHRDHAHHTELEVLTVEALPIRRSKLDSAQPVDILAGEKLDDRRGKTLGETLMAESGVHSTAYGAGSSRPIIRGLSGPRVRVLEDGLGTADTAAQSDDHAVTVDPMLIDRIEILRGPATLLYGSGAVGGVVNIIDNRIPDRVPARPLEGRFELRGDTVANERSGVVRLDGGGGNFAWHIDGTWRDADDYRIPGEARIEDDHDNDHDHDHVSGSTRLENSFVETQSGTVGASWIGERGFFGASFRAFDTEYGIPAPHDHDNDHDNDHDHDAGQLLSRAGSFPFDDDDHENGDEEEFSFVDMQQRRWDLKGGLSDPLPGFSEASLRVSYNDYRHRELPLDDHDSDNDHDHDHETFTEFDVDALQARLELEHDPIAGWIGAVGVQFDNEDLEAEGAEAFIPDGETRSVGLFALEEKTFGDVTFSAGARVERTRVEVHDDDDDGHDHDHDHEFEDIDRRTFTSWSASLGGIWQMSEEWQSSLNYSRAQRAPSQTELFADGPHLATFSFERGDPGLSKETTNGFDLIFHRHSERFDFEASVFYNDIRDFIFLEPTGHTVDGLAERVTHQEDAEFYGLETEVIWHLEENGLGHFDLRAGFDTVRGRLDDGGDLPRMSPTRWSVGADWHSGDWRGNADFQRVRSQDRVAEFESETPGYSMLSAQLSYYFDLGNFGMEAFVRGDNLLDEEARVHTSFLKDFAPLPGRNFRFGLRGRF